MSTQAASSSITMCCEVEQAEPEPVDFATDEDLENFTAEDLDLIYNDFEDFCEYYQEQQSLENSNASVSSLRKELKDAGEAYDAYIEDLDARRQKVLLEFGDDEEYIEFERLELIKKKNVARAWERSKTKRERMESEASEASDCSPTPSSEEEARYLRARIALKSWEEWVQRSHGYKLTATHDAYGNLEAFYYIPKSINLS